VAAGGPCENLSRATFDSPAALWTHCLKTYLNHILFSFAAMSAITRWQVVVEPVKVSQHPEFCDFWSTKYLATRNSTRRRSPGKYWTAKVYSNSWCVCHSSKTDRLQLDASAFREHFIHLFLIFPQIQPCFRNKLCQCRSKDLAHSWVLYFNASLNTEWADNTNNVP